MLNKIKIAAVSTMIGLGTLAAVPAAQADSFYFGITPGGPSAGIIVDEGHSYRHYDRRDDYRWGRDRDRWDRGCSTGEALRKADRMGINRARVRDVSYRSILVSGRARGRWVTVQFAKAPHCPIIR